MILPLLLATLLAASRAAYPAEAPPPEPAEGEAAADAGTPDPAYVGHYYLSGVMETGSELLLRADGKYEWYISYGAVDRYSKGRWGRRGKRVLLVADRPAIDAPLFKADERFDWDSDAEKRLLEQQYARQSEQAARRCPWAGSVVSAPSIPLLDPPPPTEQDRRHAAESRERAEALRGEADAAIRAAIAPQAEDAAIEAAESAMARWHDAAYKMEQAYKAAQLPVPELTLPIEPPECRATLAEVPDAPDQWQRAVAVLVGDPAREMRLSDVAVTFTRADGVRIKDRTGYGGWAFAPFVAGKPVVAIDLELDAGTGQPVYGHLDIAPLEQGVQAVLVDISQLVQPPFETMVLVVDGIDLVPEDMPRGRYSRP